MMEQIIEQNMFSRTLFNESKLRSLLRRIRCMPQKLEDCSDCRENAAFRAIVW